MRYLQTMAAPIAAPLAAMAFGALALGACSDKEDVLADNTYSVPSERNGPNESLSGYPSSTPATPSPGTLGNPDTMTVPPARPADPDDPAAIPPGSPPPPVQ